MAPDTSTSEAPTAAPRRGRPFYGWYLVGASSGIQLLIGALSEQAFGGYAAALTRDFGWSRGALGGVFSVARVLTGLLGMPQGLLVDRLGPQVMMRAGLVLLALGLIAFSQINSLGMFYVTYSLIALGGGLAGFISVTVAVVNWFDRYRARAIGISFVGFAAGGLLAPLVILAITTDWRATALASGVAVLVIGLPLTMFIRHRPEEMGLHVDGISPEEALLRRERDAAESRRSTSTTTDFTAREAFRTRAFWMVASGHGSALMVVSAVQVHLFLHLTESLGYADGVAAVVLGVMTAAMVVGQVVGGFLGDRMSKRVVITVCMAGHASAMLLLASTVTPALVLLSAGIHGLSWGTRGPLMAALNADYFGRTSFGSIFGVSTMVVTIGLVTGPLVAGLLYDATGSYTPGFIVIACAAALGSGFFMLATRPDLPRRAAVEGEN
ncbi:MAG: MFS transporter [Dehalococcoidia bacterium]